MDRGWCILRLLDHMWDSQSCKKRTGKVSAAAVSGERGERWEMSRQLICSVWWLDVEGQ